MELVTFAKEVVQGVAEHAASYRAGQAALRQVDRALWVVEKCAKWAVPPPLDVEERPQPELVRPLPWLPFLALLVALRVGREVISLANLVLGKPPLRSADVVMCIQSQRRYLRTLKYTGNRVNRARSLPQTAEPWYRRVQSLFEFTMCFRRQSLVYGNNNTTRVSHNDEVLVVKRKRSREQTPAIANESTMERLIEKMMVDLDAESDDDSSFTLTTATSLRSDQSEDSSDQETLERRSSLNSTIASLGSSENSASPLQNDVASSTPEKSAEFDSGTETGMTDSKEDVATPKPKDKSELSEPNVDKPADNNRSDDFELIAPKVLSTKEESKNFILGERCAPPKQQKSKLGRKILLALRKVFKKHEKIDIMGLQAQRRTSDVADGK